MILINPKAKHPIHPNRDPLLRNRIKSLHKVLKLSPYILVMLYRIFYILIFVHSRFFETIAWIWEMIN